MHTAHLSIQIFPVHLIQFVSQLSFDSTFFQKTIHLPCNLFSEKWLAELKILDGGLVLAHECGILGLLVKPSTIPYVGAVLG